MKTEKIRNLSLIMVAAAFAAPFVYITLTSFSFSPEEFREIFNRYDLFTLLLNTFVLIVCVGLLSMTFGLFSAWFVTMYDFPLRKLFSVLLIFPLAFPAYVLAFSWTGFFGFSGIINKILSPNSIFFLDIFRNLAGATLVLSFALYPYIYLIAKSAFATMGKRSLEVANIHGYSDFEAFFRIIIPQIKPWLISGLILVWFETLADFGAVSILSVDTFTTAIYKAWYGYFKIEESLLLAFFLLIKVFILLWILRLIEGNKYYTQTERQDTNIAQKKNLSPFYKSLVFIFLTSLCTLSFAIPSAQLFHWIFAADQLNLSDISQYTFNTFSLAVAGALCIVLLSLYLGFCNKFYKNKLSGAVGYLVKSGYAYPGSVLAVALFIPIINLSQNISSFTGVSLNMQSTVLPLFLGYIIRFSAVASAPVNGGYQRLKKSVLESAALLTDSVSSKLFRIVLPVLKPGIISAFILTFIDISKEMPLTLMTRPFGFDTLAVKIYGLTSEGEWERAALPAIIIVFLGFIPIAFSALLRRKNVHPRS